MCHMINAVGAHRVYLHVIADLQVRSNSIDCAIECGIVLEDCALVRQALTATKTCGI